MNKYEMDIPEPKGPPVGIALRDLQRSVEGAFENIKELEAKLYPVLRGATEGEVSDTPNIPACCPLDAEVLAIKYAIDTLRRRIDNLCERIAV